MKSFRLDFDNRGSFLLLFDRYCYVFTRIYWVSAVATLLAICYGWQHIANLFGAATVFSILFQGWLLWAYEATLQGDVYSMARYAVTCFLGFGAALCFMFGVISAVAGLR